MTALFGGVLGHAQDLQVLVDAAWRVRTMPEIRFALIGDGPAKQDAIDGARARGLTNVEFRSFMPPLEYARFVEREAGCGLVTLKPRVSSIPSKIGTFLSMGLPIVASLPDGDAANLVGLSGAGIRLVAGDSDGMARAIVGLASYPDLREQLSVNGRAFARTMLSAEKAFNAWDRLLKGVCDV